MRAVEVFVMFFGVSFWLCSPLLLCIWEVDNLGVVRHGGRLLDGHRGSIPFELVKDGDLLLLIERMLRLRGLDTVRITRVKGHADEGMVLDGRVRELDRLGNASADEAADFGRRRVDHSVIDARRNLSGVCGRWYPVILDLHRFFIAIARAVVNHDDRNGVAPDPLVWSAGARPKRRRLLYAIRDRAFLPGPPGIWIRNGLLSLHLSSVLMTLLIGPALLVCWSNGLLFLVLCIGPLGVWTLVSVVFPMLSSSNKKKAFGLVRGCLWRRLILVILGRGVQFQCRLFRLVQALIFGVPVVSLVQ